MARVAITPAPVTRDGLDDSTVTETTGDATNHHSVINRGSMWVEVRNSNGAATARTVTYRLVGGADGQTIAPKTKSIAAGQTFRMGPWPIEAYGGTLLIDVEHADLKLRAFYLTF